MNFFFQKNRYKNIVLFDEGAVILSTGKYDKISDTYIHATKIKTKFGNYVLAQSPKSETLNDWYRMIWQLNIAVIVCLIPLSTKEDCAKYFERKIGKKLK
uniref:Tyrosine-protein phosphatase domain-containing protein n=1 Tax=Ascaris lumbricoides TaxID=6252 RepID=A0A0M3HI33_ASCLU